MSLWGRKSNLIPWQAMAIFAIVDTFGYVPGHIGLIVYSDEGEEKRRVTYLLPGDTTYGIELLEK